MQVFISLAQEWAPDLKDWGKDQGGWVARSSNIGRVDDDDGTDEEGIAIKGVEEGRTSRGRRDRVTITWEEDVQVFRQTSLVDSCGEEPSLELISQWPPPPLVLLSVS